MPRKTTSKNKVGAAVPNLESFSKEDLLAMLAKEFLARRGEDAPAKAPSRRKKDTDPPKEVDWSKQRRTCPQCGHEGPVDPDFGVKVVRGLVRSQSWCKSCRATTNYYARDRKYKTGR